jgi:hypothetical protein
MKEVPMITNCVGLAARLLSMLCLVFFAAFPVSAQEVQSGPEVIEEDYHDTSIPVRDLTPVASPAGSQRVVVPLRQRPGPPIISSEPDAVSQNLEQGPLVGTTNKLNFDGVPIRDSIAPPDTNASVGATQVVEVVNISFQVFSKSTGHSVFGPAEISRIWSGFGGVCGNPGNSFTDPVVLYDKAAGRWLVAIVASPDGFKTGVECIAVSKTSDATGSYNRYVFSFGINNLNDYDKFGVWPDAYYGSYNMFSPTQFLGAKVCAYPRGAMLAGQAASSICFQRSTSDFTLLPSDLDGHTAPATGEPNFFLELATSAKLNLFKFHVNFTTSALSAFTGPTMLTVPSFTEACAATGTCIPQPGTTQRLDSLGDRMMFRLAYRKFADHEALVATHSVKTNVAASGVRWYEIRNPNTSPIVFQRGTVTAGSTTLWMGSIGMDKVGDIALGFSESSSNLHPAIAYTGRVPTDPPGTMQSIDVTFKGKGSQTSGLSRWGDYSSVSIDPIDDCTFWYANEYIPSNGIFNWHTRLNSFKFTSCK